MGLKIAVCSNSNTPLKRIKVIEECSGVKIQELFDAFIVSGDVGVRKPNPEILLKVLQAFPEVKPYEAFLIGDQIDRDIVCAHLCSIRSIYFGLAPYNREANLKALAHGHAPHFSLLDFRQLPAVVRLMGKDAEFIRAK
jgi:putative hydrolase of the HAD superfamily